MATCVASGGAKPENLVRPVLTRRGSADADPLLEHGTKSEANVCFQQRHHTFRLVATV